MASVRLERVYKRFGSDDAVCGVDLEVADGELVVLLGPSGCGKSTILRMIAGLEEISSGSILVDGEPVGPATRDGDLAMLYQSYALYPRMSVRQNIGFGLRMRGLPEHEIAARVEKVAAILGLRDLLEQVPPRISPAERQRVAIGRAIVRQPAVFLLDEPLGNIDAALQAQMRAEIARLHERLATTIIYATHDQVEAMSLASRLVVMDRGVVQQVGTPREVERRPASLLVAGIVGTPMNLLEVTLAARDGRLLLAGDGFELPLPERLAERAGEVGRALILGVRPEHMSEALDRSATIPAHVTALEQRGAELHARCEVAGQPVTALLSPGTAVRAGDAIALSADAAALHVFDKQTGASLAED